MYIIIVTTNYQSAASSCGILHDQKTDTSIFNGKVSAVTHNGNTKIPVYLKVVVVFGELMTNTSIVWNNHGNDFKNSIITIVAYAVQRM